MAAAVVVAPRLIVVPDAKEEPWIVMAAADGEGVCQRLMVAPDVKEEPSIVVPAALAAEVMEERRRVVTVMVWPRNVRRMMVVDYCSYNLCFC